MSDSKARTLATVPGALLLVICTVSFLGGMYSSNFIKCLLDSHLRASYCSGHRASTGFGVKKKTHRTMILWRLHSSRGVWRRQIINEHVNRRE